METAIIHSALITDIKDTINAILDEQKSPVWVVEYDDGYSYRERYDDASIFNFSFANTKTYACISFSVLADLDQLSGTLVDTCNANERIVLSYDFELKSVKHIFHLIKLSIYSLETVRRFTVAPLTIDYASSYHNALWRD
ncbi:hypothetical protein [Flaviaesturariibacter amylovorans]|uniref:YbjN domain-containing protein n=1 Tax=Flaviaesturariibacter amylovorans TaxID=1084520 RepID=A0ABP8GKW7_9BACT